ncbi:SusC/RagA family TonB-linked outer membrane protein [Maribacter sp. 2304DJ31-5]|uniref:SusC/RagA family TonB-linked outer membrane protein n=1 Tax=Maribacter sp. 2304DJ31-5 TaxID=3386273 RepID=UPI0039BC25F5
MRKTKHYMVVYSTIVTKLLAIMKCLSLILLVFACYSFTSSYAQNTKLKLDLKQASLIQIIEEIERQSDFLFIYNDEVLPELNKVVGDVVMNNVKIVKILNEVVDKENLKYVIKGRQVIMRKSTRRSRKKTTTPVVDVQEMEIKGTVTAADDGAPLPGANVIKVGTDQGTQTDFDGNYTINAEKGDVLQFSYIGFKVTEVTVGDSEIINVTLQEDSESLDEVVVVGFGTQKKESVVGAMSSIKPAELKIPSSNLTSALAGRISGVIGYQRSGEPGADNAQFFIRGVTTFASQAVPLILIDGVELTADDLARLNPDDIESFAVLKDATATAVYGARGANGIIYVTTKQGVTGKARVSLRIENSFSQNTQVPELTDPITYMRLANEAVITRTPNRRVPFSEEQILSTQRGINSNVFPVTDWQNELIKKTAVNQRMNMNVTGGGEVAQYYIAASFNKDNGILREDSRNNVDNNINLKRYLLRSNITINLSETTKAIVRLHGTLDEFRGPSISGTNVFGRTLRTSPVRFPAVYDPDEASVNSPNILFGNQRTTTGDLFLNPYAELVSGTSETSRSLNLIQFELKQDLSSITPGLKARFLGNNNRTSFYRLVRISTPFFYNAELFNFDRLNNTYILSDLNSDGSRALRFDRDQSETTVNNVLYGELAFNYDRTFNEKHTISGLLVGIARELNDGNADDVESALPSRNLGFSGRFTYDYDSRYFVEFNFGYNGSERFASRERFGFFPSVGAGWLVSDEPFFEKAPDFISRLKFRASYGLVGNDAIGNRDDRFFYRSRVNLNDPSRGYVFGGGTIPGVSISRYGNELITWEVGKKFNAGMELNLFNDAVQIRADYFSEVREDILQTRVTPTSLGLQAANRANVGTAFSRGVDASVELNKSFSNDLWVTGRANFTYSKANIRFVEEPDFAQVGAPHRSAIGAVIGQRFGYIAERLFIDEADIASSPIQNFGINAEPLPGDIKYRDVDGDGEITNLDQVPLGNPIVPQITYGFGLSAGYKNFDISAFFQGNAKVSLFIDPVQTAPFVTRVEDFTSSFSFLGGGNTLSTESTILKAYADDHWSLDNRNPYALYPRLSNRVEPNNVQRSSWWLRDASFLRLKQVEVGYTFRELSEKLGMGTVRLYATGTNLFLLSRFKLWDPEVGSNDPDQENGGNGFGYPLQRVINLGLQLNF